MSQLGFPSQPQMPAAPLYPPKPGKVTAMGIITVCSGGLNAFYAIFWFFYVLVMGLATFGIACIFIVFPIYLALVATFEILYGIKLLANPMRLDRPSMAVPILEITAVISCNPIPLVAGILNLVFASDPEVKNYFAASGSRAFPIQPRVMQK